MELEPSNDKIDVFKAQSYSSKNELIEAVTDVLNNSSFPLPDVFINNFSLLWFISPTITKFITHSLNKFLSKPSHNSCNYRNSCAIRTILEMFQKIDLGLIKNSGNPFSEFTCDLTSLSSVHCCFHSTFAELYHGKDLHKNELIKKLSFSLGSYYNDYDLKVESLLSSNIKPSIKNGLILKQFEFYSISRRIFENELKHSSLINVKDSEKFKQEELEICESNWIDCIKALNQWEVLHNYVKSTKISSGSNLTLKAEIYSYLKDFSQKNIFNDE